LTNRRKLWFAHRQKAEYKAELNIPDRFLNKSLNESYYDADFFDNNATLTSSESEIQKSNNSRASTDLESVQKSKNSSNMTENEEMTHHEIETKDRMVTLKEAYLAGSINAEVSVTISRISSSSSPLKRNKPDDSSDVEMFNINDTYSSARSVTIKLTPVMTKEQINNKSMRRKNANVSLMHHSFSSTAWI